MQKITLRIITIIVCCSVITSCKGIGGLVSFKPIGTPLKVSVNTKGEISLSVEGDVPIPTPLGTLEIGVVADPSEYFGVNNTLTIRLNGVDRIYDLHGYDFELKFEPGYYKEINVSKDDSNLFLQLTESDAPVINFKTLDWPDRIVFVDDGTVYETTSSGGITALFVAPKDAQWMRWSPDGKYIAYQGTDRDGHGGLFVMDSDGRNGRTLFLFEDYWRYGSPFHLDLRVEDLTWSSDSKRLLFSSDMLALVDIETGAVTPLGRCSNHDQFQPAGVWAPEHIAWNSRNDRIAFVDWSNGAIYTRPLRNFELDECEQWLAEDHSSDDFTSIRGPLLFSNDSPALIFNNDGMLWRVPAPGTAPVKAIRIGKIFEDWSYTETMIWDPSGRYIAITGNHDITVFDTATGDAMIVITKYYEYTSLGWIK